MTQFNGAVLKSRSNAPRPLNCRAPQTSRVESVITAQTVDKYVTPQEQMLTRSDIRAT